MRIANGAGYDMCMWAAAGTGRGRMAPTKERVVYEKIIIVTCPGSLHEDIQVFI